MKIFSLEAVNMGNNQNEIVTKVEGYVKDVDFKSPEEFYDQEGSLIKKACEEMAWTSCPQTGGFVVHWDSPTGDFK